MSIGLQQVSLIPPSQTSSCWPGVRSCNACFPSLLSPLASPVPPAPQTPSPPHKSRKRKLGFRSIVYPGLTKSPELEELLVSTMYLMISAHPPVFLLCYIYPTKEKTNSETPSYLSSIIHLMNDRNEYQSTPASEPILSLTSGTRKAFFSLTNEKQELCE